MKKYILAPTTAFAILIGFGSLSACASPQKNSSDQPSAVGHAQEQSSRVVISVRTERHVMAALKAVDGLRALDPPVKEIRILAAGDALHGIQKDGPWAEELEAAMQDGVKVYGCKLAMNRMGIDPDTFVDGVQLVDHVFVEAVRLQQQGFYSLEY